jgi:hypothetical protein
VAKPRRPLLTAEDQARHRALMNQSAPAAAYDHLRQAFEAAGYELRSLGGVIKGVAIWDQFERYLFAWQVQPHHLLFYIRKPALKVAAELHSSAVSHHPAEQVNVNNGDETTVKLRSLTEARTLTEWLMPQLPLPVAPPKR